MQNIKLTSLPVILFAHKFVAESYSGTLVPNNAGKIEVTIITEGSITIEHNGKTYVAERGDVLCNLFKMNTKVFSELPHEHHTVCFGVSFDMVDKRENGAISLPLITHPPKNTTILLRLIDEIIKSNATNAENRLKHAGLFLQLLGELDNFNKQIEKNTSPYEYHYVNRAKKYIYDHISEPILQKDISEYLGITPEYLCAVFKKVEGRSIIKFINEFKLTQIRFMMETMDIPLNQAAQQYGFSDPNYVSKLYKKYYSEPITRSVKLTKESNEATLYEPPRD